MSKRVLIVVAGGAAGALLAVSAFSGVPGGFFLPYIAPLPLLMVGLAHGAGALGLAAAAGIIICVAVGGAAAAAVYAALSALPSWLIVQLALKKRAGPADAPTRWQPIGTIAAVLALVVGFTMVMLAVASMGDGPIETTLRSQLLESLTASLPELDPSVVATLVDRIAHLFLGFSAAIWLVMIAGNGMLAENMLAARGLAIRPRPQWSAFALPSWFAWPLVISAAIGLIPTGDTQFIARNLVLVFATGYLFQGLATIHTLAREARSRRALLAGVYLLLLLFSLFAAPLVAGLGMIDQWAGIRRRSAGPRGEWE